MNLELLTDTFAISPAFSVSETIFQMVVLLLLSSFLSIVYLFRGNSLSNRSRLAALLPLMAVTTMLIISVVKSSLALSLGLVGALSIVRFRAAIKDPEELAYIFLAIALGLGFGATQITMTTTFYGVILAYILVQSVLKQFVHRSFTDRDAVHIELTFQTEQKLESVIAALEKHSKKIKLTRAEFGEQQSCMFLIKPKSAQALQTLQAHFSSVDPQMRMTILQYNPLV